MFLFYLLQQNISAQLHIILSASFWISLVFAWLRLCHDQAACAQSEALGL